MTDLDGNKIADVDYTPYGEQTTTGENIFNKKYTGQTEDHKTELIYYNARYYDPQIGRFITPDSIIPDMANSQSLNRYMYVLGNPINYSDPTGHLSVKSAVKKVTNTVTNAAKIAGNMIKSGAKSIKNSVLNKAKQTTQGFLAGVGGVTSIKDNIKSYWQDNKWFRITTYVVITALVIAACIFIGPAVLGAASAAAQGMIIGAIAGAAIGGIYGGTNGFKGGWNWEKAAQYMMKGAIIGAVLGYSIGNFFDFVFSDENYHIFQGERGFKIQHGGISGWFANGLAALTDSSILSLCIVPVAVLSLRSIKTFPQDTERLLNHREFTYIPWIKIKF